MNFPSPFIDRFHDLLFDIQDLYAAKKQIIGIGATAILVILLAGIGVFAFNKTETSLSLASILPTKQNATTASGSESTASGETLHSAAIPESCTTIQDEVSKQACVSAAITESAKLSADPKQCESITADTDRSFCRTSAITAMAQAKGDATICTQIADAAQQTICTTTLASSASGSNVAETASGSTATGAPIPIGSLCATKTDNELTDCRNREVLKWAVAEKSIEKCEQSLTEVAKTACKTLVAGNESTFDTTLSGSGTTQSGSLSVSSALSTTEEKVCGSIENPRMQEVCIDSLAVAKAVEAKDVEKCRVVQNHERKNACELSIVGEFAKQHFQSALAYCNAIEDDRTRSACIDSLGLPKAITTPSHASSTELSKPCKNITEPKERLECLRSATE